MSERELKIEELQAENQRLRIAVAALSAALLCGAAVDSVARKPAERADAERLLREAEHCFRCAGIPELKSAVSRGLEIAGHELMAKAVEIESRLQRERRKNSPPGTE
jgi:hypothetical protein